MKGSKQTVASNQRVDGRAMRFSWSMTTMLHHFEGEDSFAAQMRRATLDHLANSETARRDLAENYVGLPF